MNMIVVIIVYRTCTMKKRVRYVIPTIIHQPMTTISLGISWFFLSSKLWRESYILYANIRHIFIRASFLRPLRQYQCTLSSYNQPHLRHLQPSLPRSLPSASSSSPHADPLDAAVAPQLHTWRHLIQHWSGAWLPRASFRPQAPGNHHGAACGWVGGERVERG